MIRASRATSALDAESLFDPPDGYRFANGYLITYELSLDTLLRRVLAPLTNADADEPLEVGVAEPVLTVAYERKHPGPILPSQGIDLVRVHAADGRPLHAKGGLLRFEPDDRRRRPLVRGWTGSANLTDGGLCHNRELILSGQRTDTGTDDVVDTAIALCRIVARATRSTRAVTKLLAGLDAPTGRARTRLLETITTRESLLDRVKPPEGFNRLDIITPPFQSQGTGPSIAKALAPILPASGPVHIYTSTPLPLRKAEEAREKTAFSAGLVGALRGMNLKVEVHFTPEVRDEQRRSLHAKAFVLHGTSGSVALIGSANCTVSGLGGANREATAVAHLARDEAEQLIHDGFQDWIWTGLEIDEDLLEARDVDTPDTVEPFPDAFARLTPETQLGTDGVRGRWAGTLTAHGLVANATVTVTVAGRSVHARVAADGTLDIAAAFGSETIGLLPEHGTVTITTTSGQTAELVVYVHASRDWFVKMLEARNRPPRSRPARDIHELHLLLRGLRQARNTRFNLASPTANTGLVADDRLTLPIDRRFDFLAKHVAQLPAWADDELLGTFLEVHEDDARLTVARAIKAAPHERSEDPLLELLQQAIHEREKRHP